MSKKKVTTEKVISDARAMIADMKKHGIKDSQIPSWLKAQTTNAEYARDMAAISSACDYHEGGMSITLSGVASALKKARKA
jgi:hypothetical protein